MKRSLMVAYLKRSDEAVPFYQHAFGAELVATYLNSDGTYYHAELDIEGQILAITERNEGNAIHPGETISGNIMQFCLHYGQENEAKLRSAYEVLKTDATIITPLAPCEYSSLAVDLIDQYGIRWGLFV